MSVLCLLVKLSTHHFSTFVFVSAFFFQTGVAQQIRESEQCLRGFLLLLLRCLCCCSVMDCEGSRTGASSKRARARQMTEREWTRSFNERASWSDLGSSLWRRCWRRIRTGLVILIVIVIVGVVVVIVPVCSFTAMAIAVVILLLLWRRRRQRLLLLIFGLLPTMIDQTGEQGRVTCCR